MTEQNRFEQLLSELDSLQNQIERFLDTQGRVTAEKSELERKLAESKKENEFLKFQIEVNQKELETLRTRVLQSPGMSDSEKEELKGRIAEAITIINNRLADGIKGE
ncbi:MAG: hypothetical protein IT279_03705 [Ignavibacteriaceae bacterium]|nr:hypothetical protein [Ignavibacteriaceae bacterium]